MEVVKWKKGLKDIVDFYKSCQYEYHPTVGETIFVATDKTNKIFGVLRISEEDGTLHLRGMQISKDYQRRGVGTLMLRKISKAIEGKSCYLVGYPHLKHFYGQAGFQEIAESNVPLGVKRRYKNAQKRFPKTKYNLMVRGNGAFPEKSIS
jgi:N-acetylglutamate synthase-like GNAT family acetyltransferase